MTVVSRLQNQGLIPFRPSLSLPTQWMLCDPFYLSGRNYQRVLDAKDYSASGSIAITSEEGLPIFVGSTFGGDGEWYDNEEHLYSVETGQLGLFPRALFVPADERTRILGDGRLAHIHEDRTIISSGFKFDLVGAPTFEAIGGLFTVGDAMGRVIIIDTREETDEDGNSSEEEEAALQVFVAENGAAILEASITERLARAGMEPVNF